MLEDSSGKRNFSLILQDLKEIFMKRRTFLQTVSASSLGLLTQTMFGQQPPKDKTIKKLPAGKVPAGTVASPGQKIIDRFQQVAEGGS